MLAHAALPTSEIELPPLEAFPWLVRAEQAPSVALVATAKAEPGGSRKLLLHAGIAMAFAALCGGVAYLSGVTDEAPAPAMELASRPQPITAPAAPSALAADPADDSAALLAAPETLATAPERGARAASAAGIQTPAPASGITPAPAEGQAALAADTPSLTAGPTPPVADSTASAATLREFRLAMDQGRDAVRQVIRLGSRQKPPRDAAPEELTAYRLRQQNAEAARGYRNYLDTLARSMRGTQSETVARQSLDKARQTLGYLTTMLADSQASLR